MLETVKATWLRDGYAKKRGLDGWYRDLTVQEAKTACPRCLYLCAASSASVHDSKLWEVYECRVNGKPKTWKRSPGCVLSLVYGLKNYFQVGEKELPEESPISRWSHRRIVVPVQHAFIKDALPEAVLDWVLQYEIN